MMSGDVEVDGEYVKNGTPSEEQVEVVQQNPTRPCGLCDLLTLSDLDALPHSVARRGLQHAQALDAGFNSPTKDVVEDPEPDQSDLNDDDQDQEVDDLLGDFKKEDKSVPDHLRQLPVQRKKKRKEQISACISRCRGCLRVMKLSIGKLGWEEVCSDNPAVSVALLEQNDSSSTLSPLQIMSKIGGMMQVCRKANLAECLQTMQDCYPDDYEFAPRTWIISAAMPSHIEDLEKAMARSRGRTFICKPTNGCCGVGIKLGQVFADLRSTISAAFDGGSAGGVRKAEFVVQQYVAKPLLIDGFKFDCRCYVVVTSVVPLRAYLFEEGLARFCTKQYKKPSKKNINQRLMHLTNYAVNKGSSKFSADESHDTGSKRSMSSVFALIEANGGPSVEALWGEVQVLSEKTLIALRPKLVEYAASGEREALHPTGPKGFHILGFDILFDEDHKAHVIEVNSSASMSITHPVGEKTSDGKVKVKVCELDRIVKEELICQSLLCANPLPHQIMLRKRATWLQSLGATAHRLNLGIPLDEPIPLDDDGQFALETEEPQVQPRADRPDRCPALRPLEFDSHSAMEYARLHLSLYRVWRHYVFNPPGSVVLKPGQQRRYIGFHRAQFKQVCDAGGLVGADSGLWLDRTSAELFYARIPRFDLEAGDGVGGASLDSVFTRFISQIVMPLAKLLVGGPKVDASSVELFQAFLERVSVPTGEMPPIHYYPELVSWRGQ